MKPWRPGDVKSGYTTEWPVEEIRAKAWPFPKPIKIRLEDIRFEWPIQYFKSSEFSEDAK